MILLFSLSLSSHPCNLAFSLHAQEVVFGGQRAYSSSAERARAGQLHRSCASFRADAQIVMSTFKQNLAFVRSLAGKRPVARR